jgi:cobalt/nickel transport system permease protein
MDAWARTNSAVHNMSPKAKIIILCAFLIAVSTTPPKAILNLGAFATFLFFGMVCSTLPVTALLVRSAFALPFNLTFAMLSYFSLGDVSYSVGLLFRGQLCVLGTLLMVATTPLPLLLRALESLGIPTVIVQVAQFIYRYLFVIADQGQRMRLAATARNSGKMVSRQGSLERAGGALAVLFSCSYQRAEKLHRATISRGPDGRFPILDAMPFGLNDTLTVIAFLCAILGVRLASFY